jgi:hypothetical protein
LPISIVKYWTEWSRVVIEDLEGPASDLNARLLNPEAKSKIPALSQKA